MKIAVLNKLWMSDVRRRTLLGVGANALSKAWVILLQLLFLAVLPRVWGAQGYGVWIVLSALVTYIVLSDLGFGNAAATDMIRSLTMGNPAAAAAALQSAWVLVTVISGGVLLAAGLGGLAIWLIAPGGVSADVVWAGFALAGFAFFVLQCHLLHGGYRSTGRYALGEVFQGLFILIEGLTVVGVALAGGRFAAAAVAMLLARILGTTIYYGYLCRVEPWFRLGSAHADRATMRRLLNPALASVSMMVSSALSLQGVVIMLGIFASPAVAASYAATRTLCRMPLQLSDLVGRATLPELSIAYARQDRRLFDRVTLLNVGTALIVALPLSLLIGAAGPFIGAQISGHEVRFDHLTFAALAIATLAQAFWSAAGQSLQATNQHHLFSYPSLLLAIAQTAAPAVLSRYGDSPGLVACVVAVCEWLMVLAVLWAWLRQRARFPSVVEGASP